MTIHWIEVALNGGDCFAAILLTPKLLLSKQEEWSESFVATVNTWASIGAVAVVIIAFVYVLLTLDMMGHVRTYVSGGRFRELELYPKALGWLTALLFLLISISFLDQYVSWAKRKGLEEIFLVPGIILFLIIRIVSFGMAFGLWLQG